jgi:hypothetical protein
VSRSHFVESGIDHDFNNMKRNEGYGIDDPRIALKNKIAFLKSNGVIVRENEFEIGYKRTESNNLSTNRIILYFNNKSNKNKLINVYYSAEPDYFDINVQEKVN